MMLKIIVKTQYLVIKDEMCFDCSTAAGPSHRTAAALSLTRKPLLGPRENEAAYAMTERCLSIEVRIIFQI
jgi:hypothetical protein